MASTRIRKSFPESGSKETRASHLPLPPASIRRSTLPTPRPVMAPGVKSNPRRESTRISKSTLLGQRHPQSKLTIADEFANRMQQYRESIRSQFEQELDEVDSIHIESLNDLMEQFEAQISLLSKADEPLQSSLATEMLRVVVVDPKNHPGSDQVQFEEVVLQDRMLAFERLVKQEHKTLTRLIDDWNKVQSDILVFTVETLGSSILRMDEGQIYGDLQTALKVADAQHDKAQQQFIEAHAKLSAFEESLSEITNKTKDIVRKQQQACKIATKKHLTQLQQTIQLLAGDS